MLWTPQIYLECYNALQEKSQSGIRKLNPSLLCFGQNTTHIFEAFQVFTVFSDQQVHAKKYENLVFLN